MFNTLTLDGVWLLCEDYMLYCDQGGELGPAMWNTVRVNKITEVAN